MLVGVEEIFHGFVIQTHDAADDKLIISFTSLPATAKLLDCGDYGHAGHDSRHNEINLHFEI